MTKDTVSLFILVLVRVIQRNITNRRDYIHKWRFIIGIGPNDNRSKPGGWRPRRASNSAQVWRPKSQEHWCPGSAEEGCPGKLALLLPFGPFTPSVDRKSPPHWRGLSSLLRVSVQMQISSRRPSQTHSEIMFYSLARHPLAQSGWHIKLTTTLAHLWR